MNASKTLTSVAAAIALVGTIGFASAQNSTTDTPAATTTQQNVSASPASRAPQTNVETTQQRSMEVAPPTTNQLPSTTDNSMNSNTNTNNANSDMSMTERAPQADRN